MGRSGHLSLPRAWSVKWTVYAHERMKDAMIAELGNTFQKGRHVLARVYGLRLGYERASLPVFNAARLVHMDKFDEARRTYAHNEVAKGCVLSCPTECEGDLVTEHDCGWSTLYFYCVHAVVRGTAGECGHSLRR